MINKVVLADAFARFDDTWNPKIAGDVGDMQVKLAKFAGEFTWHHHDPADELFLVISGALRIDVQDGSIELAPGEFVVIPHGVEHRPVALPTADVLLLEPAPTVNTGSAAEDARTVRSLQRVQDL